REHAISETLFYGWRDQLLEAGRERFAGKEERHGERELRRKVAELERALGRLPAAGEETRRVMEALSQAIVNKVLHAPMVKLKDSSRAGHARRWTEMISELFGLRGHGRPDSHE
ncbi:MAG TPA: hypothetical protein VK746_22450, partial [Candidatus Eisenbacteria bacterium]|nr:hypothetical protein [Candidatus Eisenbacteria bacterium]